MDTIDILRQAERRGLIGDLKSLVDELISKDFRLSRDVYDDLFKG
jgi:predicted nucleic acid-binding protein